VNWSVGKDIIIAMAVTIPITMIISGVLYYAIFTIGGLML
jgi:phosphate/sulfate permease